tara:strand:- start:779 stop:1120 length:342 start_codon:yes stop_codon:yes gene_type:complete
LSLGSLLLSSCASFSLFGKDEVKKLEVQTKAVEREKLNLKLPSPVDLQDQNWIVITPSNMEEVWKLLKDSKKDIVLFGLTDDEYQTLSINLTKLRNIIEQQRIILYKYKEYYE